MATARWRGSRGLNETPDSPQWEFDQSGTTCTRTFHGPYNVCLNSRPLRGWVMMGFLGVVVDKTTVKKAPGGKGILTVTAFGPVTAETAPASNDGETRYEIEWCQVQKALITHTMWNDAGSPDLLTATDRAALEKWEDCPDSDIKKDNKYYTDNDARTPAGGTALSANAQKYAAKIRKGTDSWIEYIPIARKTGLTVFSPAESAAGHRQTPTEFDPLPATYVWVKTADRSIRSGTRGKWERTEEWTGFAEVDEDLYPDEVV